MIGEENRGYLRFRQDDLEIITTTREAGTLLYRAGQAGVDHATAGGAAVDDTVVDENYRRLGETLGIPRERMVRVVLDHGCAIFEADRSAGGEGVSSDRQNLGGFDALVTGERNLYLGITTADCFPVILADRQRGLVGLAHCGWRGIALRLEALLFRKMLSLGAQPRDIRAVYGPGICPDCYVQKDPLLKRVFRDDLGCPSAVILRRDGCYGIDLKEASRKNLLEAGFPGEILETGICNACDPRFFSVRREGAGTGRMLTLAALRGPGGSGAPRSAR